MLVTALAGVAVAYPSVAATTCPQCYGLVRLADGRYAERGITAAQREQLATVHAAAGRRVDVFYAGRESSPRIVACFTDTCYRRIGGGRERGVAILNRAVMLSPRGIDVAIAAHEMAHVELHRRLGRRAGRVPQWFDEGLAVVVSDDERYLLPDTVADRCRVAPDGPLPVTLQDWFAAAGADPQVYARAACRVSRWLTAHGGDPAVRDLIDRLNRGAAFPAM